MGRRVRQSAAGRLVARLLASVLFMFTAVGTLSVTAAKAAIIGENDWIPLSEAAQKYGFSQKTVDLILDSGGEMTCRGRNDKGQMGITNRFVGWVESVSPPRILTVGHWVFEKDRVTVRPVEKRKDCYFASNRAVLAGSDYPHFTIDPDITAHRFGGREAAARGSSATDRMLVQIAEPLTGVTALPLSPVTLPSLWGVDLFLVSAARPFHRNIKGGVEPMVAKCNFMGLERPTKGQPMAIITDCDAFKGVSGSILFRRSELNAGNLKPIGLQARANEIHDEDGKAKDGLPADSRINNSLSLAFDPAFFTFPVTLEQPQ